MTCPIAPTTSVVGGRWTAEVLWALTQIGPLRFSEIRRHLPQVTAKVLAQRLRQLERDGLVTRTYFREMPPRVEYEATPLAQSLGPVFHEMERWAQEHAGEVHAARSTYTGPLPA